MSQYPLTIIDEKVNEVPVRIIGVEHTLDFLLEHADFFMHQMDEAEAIVFEQPVNCAFYDSRYFGALGNDAHHYGKHIFIADPISPGLNEYDETMDYIAPSLMGPGALLAALSWLLKKNESISRRSFLRGLVGGCAAAGIGLNLFLGTTEAGLGARDEMISGSAEAFGADDLLFHGVFDYRNIIIAEGIEKICEEYPKLSRLTCIHGNYHADTVHGYLANPALRLKRLEYIPFRPFARSEKVREYMPTHEGWEKIREF